MNNEQLQLKHNDLQNRLIATRERIRQAEAQLQDLANAEQQLLGAIAIVRELLQPPPEQPPLLDNTAQ
jgi:small-conductance mechanosensitive channel